MMIIFGTKYVSTKSR